MSTKLPLEQQQTNELVLVKKELEEVKKYLQYYLMTFRRLHGGSTENIIVTTPTRIYRNGDVFPVYVEITSLIANGQVGIEANNLYVTINTNEKYQEILLPNESLWVGIGQYCYTVSRTF